MALFDRAMEMISREKREDIGPLYAHSFNQDNQLPSTSDKSANKEDRTQGSEVGQAKQVIDCFNHNFANP